MKNNELREDRAFEALIVQTLRQARSDEVDIPAVRIPNEKEKAALRNVGSDFIESLVHGKAELGDKGCDEAGLALAGDSTGGALFRTDGVDDELADELDAIDREIIERKKKEQEDNEAT